VTSEWKYLIEGQSLTEDTIVVVTKLSPTQMLVIILYGVNKMEEIICEICGKSGARIRRVTRSYGKGDDLLVIENIPVVSCPNCGESYLTADTLHEIERIKLHRKSWAKERNIPVAVFN
jgi:YgiT-type zinc finger domain-containing protein